MPSISTLMKTSIKLLIGLLLIAYPVLVYIGLSHFEVRYIGLLILLVVAIRFILFERGAGGRPLLVFITGGILAFLVLASNQVIFLKLYPVCMSALAFGVFYYSLRNPPTVIERIAQRSFTGEMPVHVVVYVRKVTKLWCGFFILNGIIALYTALWASMEIWTLYNGLISYIVMGVLFLGEMLYRKLRKGVSHV